jgi:hypothetical protein
MKRPYWLLALLLCLNTAHADPQVWNLGPFYITLYDDNASPDSIQLHSTSALTAAPTLTVADPLPPVGTVITLQVEIPRLFVLDVSHTIKDGDTPASVATDLVALVNSGANNPDNERAIKAAGIVAGNTPGQPWLAVTNPRGGEVIALVDLSEKPAFTKRYSRGNPAWDAGPILALDKMPVDPVTGLGIAPPPGSNLGHIVFRAWASDGIGDLQYITIAANSIDSDKGIAELAIYTENTKQKVLSLSPYGLFINDKFIK